jgi:hypothetical protein
VASSPFAFFFTLDMGKRENALFYFSAGAGQRQPAASTNNNNGSMDTLIEPALSEYELQRQERIARNEAMMKQLGIDNLKAALPVPKRRRRKKADDSECFVRRASSRLGLAIVVSRKVSGKLLQRAAEWPQTVDDMDDLTEFAARVGYTVVVKRQMQSDDVENHRCFLMFARFLKQWVLWRPDQGSLLFGAHFQCQNVTSLCRKHQLSGIADILQNSDPVLVLQPLFNKLTVGSNYKLKFAVCAKTRQHDAMLEGVPEKFDLPEKEIVNIRKVSAKTVLVQSRLTKGNYVTIPRQSVHGDPVGASESFCCAVRDKTDCVFGCRKGGFEMCKKYAELEQKKKLGLADLKKLAKNCHCSGCDDLGPNGNLFTDFCRLGMNCTKFSRCRQILMKADRRNAAEAVKKMAEFKSNMALLISLRQCTAELEMARKMLHKLKVTDRANDLKMTHERTICRTVVEEIINAIEAVHKKECQYTTGVQDVLSCVRDPLLISYESSSTGLDMAAGCN